MKPQARADLALVLEVAQRKRDAALQALAQTQQEQRQAMLQLSQLQGYGSETEQRWIARAADGVNTTQLHTHRQFIARLDHAMTFQHGVLEQIAQRLQLCQQQVQQAERELASLRKYQQRQQQVWQLRQQRQEQKANDEMAATQHWLHVGPSPWRSNP